MYVIDCTPLIVPTTVNQAVGRVGVDKVTGGGAGEFWYCCELRLSVHAFRGAAAETRCLCIERCITKA